MRQISSRGIFFQKVIFPVIWFGFLGFFAVIVLLTHSEGGPPLTALLVPLAMGIFGIVFMKKFIWDLADQVLDDGDALIVRFGKDEERLPLPEIINVS